jgi:hypothetical protein
MGGLFDCHEQWFYEYHDKTVHAAEQLTRLHGLLLGKFSAESGSPFAKRDVPRVRLVETMSSLPCTLG